MLWLIHIIFLNSSTELWPLIDFRIMFMLNILWNNWWIWSNLVVTFDTFYAKTCATTKISTVVVYHVVLATLLFTAAVQAHMKIFDKGDVNFRYFTQRGENHNPIVEAKIRSVNSVSSEKQHGFEIITRACSCNVFLSMRPLSRQISPVALQNLSNFGYTWQTRIKVLRRVIQMIKFPMIQMANDRRMQSACLLNNVKRASLKKIQALVWWMKDHQGSSLTECRDILPHLYGC